MNNQTLQDWTVARIMAEYDFPANAAQAIVTGAVRRSQQVGMWVPPWARDVTQADNLDKEGAWHGR